MINANGFQNLIYDGNKLSFPLTKPLSFSYKKKERKKVIDSCNITFPVMFDTQDSLA